MVKKVADPAPVVEPPSLYYCPTPRRWQFGSPGADLIQLHVEVGKAGPDGISKSELQVRHWPLTLSCADIPDCSWCIA